MIKMDMRIKWISRDRHPKGASTCRNIGVEHAQGEYLIFLDSDDLLAPHCLQQRVDIIEQNKGIDLAVFPMQYFNNKIGDNTHIWNIETEDKYLERFLSLDSVWQTTGAIWRKEAFLKTGGFDESLACWQDVDIHLKAIFNKLNIKTFYHLPIDCYYRIHQNVSISQSNLNSPEKILSRKHLYLWSIEQLGDQKHLAKSMAINIITSAVKSLNIKFALDFIKTSQQKYRPGELLLFYTYLFLYMSRLYKIRFLNTLLTQKLKQIQATIHVGKHRQ